MRKVYSLPTNANHHLEHKVKGISENSSSKCQDTLLSIGATVRISGLSKKKSQKYNDRIATIVSFDKESDRYTVEVKGLYDARNGKLKLLALKEKNLDLLNNESAIASTNHQKLEQVNTAPVERVDSLSSSDSGSSDNKQKQLFVSTEMKKNDTVKVVKPHVKAKTKQSKENNNLKSNQPEDLLKAPCKEGDASSPNLDEITDVVKRNSEIESLKNAVKALESKLHQLNTDFEKKQRDMEKQRFFIQSQFGRQKLKIKKKIEALTSSIAEIQDKNIEEKKEKQKWTKTEKTDPTANQFCRLQKLGFSGTKKQLAEILCSN